MRKDIFAFLLIFSLVGCGSHESRQNRAVFSLGGYDGVFSVDWVIEYKSCSYLYCGESSEKIMREYYEFKLIGKDNAEKIFPIVKCINRYPCFSEKRNFIFCGNYFYPEKMQGGFEISNFSVKYPYCENGRIVRNI